jgi:hypothetical protein
MDERLRVWELICTGKCNKTIRCGGRMLKDECYTLKLLQGRELAGRCGLCGGELFVEWLPTRGVEEGKIVQPGVS